VIEELVPSPAASAETHDIGDASLASLLPEERAAVAAAVPKRQREFAAVRECARRALGELDVPPVAVLSNKRGAPQWPEGIVGSMTHCAGYCAAVVARGADLHGLGIDAEPNGPLPEGVLDAVSSAGERTWIRAHGAVAPQVAWDRLLFSAKETVFKVWYPLTGRELDFSEAEIAVPDPGAGVFTARLLVDGLEVDGRPVAGFTGRWLCRNGFVVTAISL